MIRIFLIALLAVSIAGCASKPKEDLSIGDNDPAVTALSDAAQRVARAAEQAALAKSVNNKLNRVTEEYRIDLKRMPAELREPLLLEGGFNGELDVFIRSIADAIGWAPPLVLGSRPTTPLMVSMTEQRRAAVYWIADAGYQVGDMASVTVNPSIRQLVITYKEAGGVR